MDSSYKNLHRIEQLEYVHKAEYLIYSGLELRFDQTKEDLAEQLYNKYIQERIDEQKFVKGNVFNF